MGLMTDALFHQEWYLSVEAAIEGAIWGKEMSMVRQQGRILRGIFDPLLPVDTDWDLGIADHMTIACSQESQDRRGPVRLRLRQPGRGHPALHRRAERLARARWARPGASITRRATSRSASCRPA
jgi:hypothetical protein